MAAHAPSDKFTHFYRIKAIPYTHIRNQAVELDILIPKTVTSGTHPVLVNYLGGGLVTGSRSFEPFWCRWILDEALAQNAILVAPDYPRVPESSTAEVVTSLRSFMDWIGSGALQVALDQHAPELKVHVDTLRLQLAGESAGGWCALHIALAYPEKVRSLILRFPMLDLASPTFRQPTGLTEFMGMPIPGVEIVDKHLEHIKKLPPGTIVTEGGLERTTLAFGALAGGRILELWGTGRDTFPLEMLPGAKLPARVWLLHGTDDRIVSVEGSVKAASLFKQHVPATALEFDTRPGDHGFDTDWTAASEPLIAQRLAWLREIWLA